VRVPIPVVLFLALAVVGGVWWGKTRDYDFMTPPSEARLEEIRQELESSFPEGDQPEDAISVPVSVPEPPPPPVKVEPAFDLGDPMSKPELDAYADRARLGAKHFVELAKRLEAAGYFQRALLAWERVLDQSKADEKQVSAAISGIRRLRPTLPDWNTEPAAALPITLQAGTGRSVAKRLTPVLEEVARELEHASSGIVTVKPSVAAGRDLPGKTPSPIAIWLAGPDKKSPSTEVLSFTNQTPETLREEVLKTVFVLLRGQLERGPDFTAPAALAEGEDPRDALEFRVTRRGWKEFADSLNAPPPKAE
jgi:hypothetical protein